MFNFFQRKIPPRITINTLHGKKEILTNRFMPWFLVRCGYCPEYYIYHKEFTTPCDINELPDNSYAVIKPVYDKLVKIHKRMERTIDTNDT